MKPTNDLPEASESSALNLLKVVLRVKCQKIRVSSVFNPWLKNILPFVSLNFPAFAANYARNENPRPRSRKQAHRRRRERRNQNHRAAAGIYPHRAVRGFSRAPEKNPRRKGG